MDSRKIMEHLYPGVSPHSQIDFKGGGTAGKWLWIIIIGSLIITVWTAVHLYYYNLLVNLECNTKAAWAQVEAQFQQRFHIQKNLAKIVVDYSKYEENLLTHLTKMRTSAVNTKPAKSPEPPEVKEMTPVQLDKLFSNIMLVAEQYPQLKLTENFQQFSKAIIDVENQIVVRIMTYNDTVNAYTTTLTQFPGRIFGVICGFSPRKFYTPKREKLDFQPVEY